MKKKDETCATCKFMDFDDDVEVGQEFDFWCCRYPPTNHNTLTGAASWPVVFEDTWCGEYKRDKRRG